MQRTTEEKAAARIAELAANNEKPPSFEVDGVTYFRYDRSYAPLHRITDPSLIGR